MIIGPRRHQALADTRFAIMLAARRAGFSYSKIGLALNRDHSTIVTGSQRAQERAAASSTYAAFVTMLEGVE
jgi:chromosomal replication initiation ATPase DnaA